jgi:amidase
MNELSILQAQQQMQNFETNAVELTKLYLGRIKQHAHLNSVLETNPDALGIARALDKERRAGHTRSPLHGIPVLIKDNISTGDQMQTTAGSSALLGHFAVEDAELVRRLRLAGAIVLGKTNMTEWANFMTIGMPNGYSSRGGQTKNPYNSDWDTGGSSSGTGVAIAANMAVVGVGTETSGSILSPSHQNSLVGIKPTVGLVSRRGIVPISSSQDTAGPMARTVQDAALLLAAMLGRDPRDPISKTQPPMELKLERTDLKGVRLGVPRAAFWEYPTFEQLAVLESALGVLRDLGASLRDPADLPHAKEVANQGFAVLIHEFRRDLNKYLRHTHLGSLKELIRCNDLLPDSLLKYGQTLLLAAQTAGGVGSLEYQHARAEDLRLSKGGLDAVLNKYKLDALVFPMYWGAKPGAKAGYPTVIVPIGYTQSGQPIGISFLGRAFSETRLLEIAYAFEQATQARVPPRVATK